MSKVIVWNVAQDHRRASERLRLVDYDAALLTEAPPWADVAGLNPGVPRGWTVAGGHGRQQC